MYRDKDVSLFHNLLLSVGPGTVFLLTVLVLTGLFFITGGAEKITHLFNFPLP